MSYQDELKFIVSTEENHGYDVAVKKVYHKYSSFMSTMRDSVNRGKLDTGHCITTELGGYLGTRYLAVIDCDSCDALDATTVFLSRQRIAYAVMLSSYKYDPASNHYWIICDKVGSHKDISEFIKGVPGVDPKFALCTKESGVINLRAYPRCFSPPIYIYKCASNTQGVLPSRDFSNWVDCFKAYWYSDDMKNILRQMILLHNPQPHLDAMGCHLPPEWMKDVKAFLSIAAVQRIQIKNCLHGMRIDED